MARTKATPVRNRHGRCMLLSTSLSPRYEERRVFRPKAEKKKKKRRRMTPGARAEREIRHYQELHPVELLIRRAPIYRLIREIALKLGDYRFTELALEALHEITEAVLVESFQKSVVYATRAGRSTVFQEDFGLAFRDCYNPSNHV